MFGRAYFGGAYYGARYWGDGGSGAPPGASAAQVWNYVLSNGLTAGQCLVQLVTQVNELHQIHGLQAAYPLSVTEASRTAAAIVQDIVSGSGTTTVTRQ